MAIKLRLITVKEAAEMLGLSEKTIHNRKGGTEKLQRVYQGRAVRLIESEVETHKAKLIDRSRLPKAA